MLKDGWDCAGGKLCGTCQQTFDRERQIVPTSQDEPDVAAFHPEGQHFPQGRLPAPSPDDDWHMRVPADPRLNRCWYWKAIRVTGLYDHGRYGFTV